MIKGYLRGKSVVCEVLEALESIDGYGVSKTPQELRRELQRERRTATKERDLDRRTKRKNKRSQAY